MIQFITPDEFLTWAVQRGVGLQERYPSPTSGHYLNRTYGFRFLSGRNEARLWTIPQADGDHSEAANQLVFLTQMLSGLDTWQSCGILKRKGDWSFGADAPDAMTVLERGLGIPPAFDGALLLDATERPALILLLLTLIAFGWNTLYDLWVLPDHGRQMLFLDHEGALHVRFPDVAGQEEYTARLAAQGVHLPTRPPDTIFRLPDWMGPAPPDWRQ